MNLTHRHRNILCRLLAIFALGQLTLFPGALPFPKANAQLRAQTWDVDVNRAYFDRSSSYTSGGTSDPLHLPPDVTVTVIGTGIDQNALPAGTVVQQGFGVSRDTTDPVGRSTADASVIAQLYPSNSTRVSLHFVSFAVQGTDCLGGVAAKVLSALNIIAANPTAYNAVLMDFDPRCVEDPIQWAWDQVGGDGGQGRMDQVNREILSHPIPASKTTEPGWGPAMTFNTFTTTTAYGPPGYKGSGNTRATHPYHDISPELDKLEEAGPSYKTWQLTSVLDTIKGLGLPVIAPSGDNRTINEITNEPNLQTILGLSQLDSVITVGAAATTTAGVAKLAPISGVGLTRMGTIKPDLIAPGYQSIWIPNNSALYNSACRSSSGADWNNYNCHDSSLSRLDYLPTNPTGVDPLTPLPAATTGFGSSYIAASWITAQVLALRNVWPGGWPGADMTGVVRSVLQAIAAPLSAVAPYEQGAGFIRDFPTATDVQTHALPTKPANMKTHQSTYSCGGDVSLCPSDGSVTFYEDGALPVSVTGTVKYLEGGDVTGSARSADVNATADSTATVASTLGCTSTTPESCNVTFTVVGPSTYAGVYCGWYKVTGTSSATGSPTTQTAQYPFCSPRVFPLKIHVYFPESRPVNNDVVSLDLYDPLYLGLGPFEFMPIQPDPGHKRPKGWEDYPGEPYGMFMAPPNVTVYSGNTDDNGDVEFYDVMPGLYNMRIYADYGVTATVGTTTTAIHSVTSQPLPTTTALAYTPTELGTAVNYGDMWPLAIGSSFPCPSEAAAASRITDTVTANLPTWLACRPDRQSWTNGLQPDQLKYFYSENEGLCLDPATPAPGGTPPQFKTVWRQLFGLDSPPPDAPPPPSEISFICSDTPTSTVTGTANVRLGVGFVSQRIKNLKFGTPSVTGTVDYQMTDPDVPVTQTTQHDFEYGVCAYTTYQLLSLPGFPGNCANASAGSWVWDDCPVCEHPDTNDSIEMSFQPIANALPTPGAKLPFGFMHHRISLARPNYFAHLDISYGYEVTNTLVAIIARAGEDVRIAIPSFAGYTSSYGVPVYGGGYIMDPLDNLEAQIKACSSGCTSATAVAGRASVSFDFPKALNTDHADLFFLAIPTSWIDPAIFRIDTPGYSVRTSDKPKFCKPNYCWNQDGFVTMTMADGSHLADENQNPPTHPDSTDTLRLDFSSSILPQDAYPGDWICRDQFGCDNMFVSFGTPKGAPTTTTGASNCATYSRLQDVVERKPATKAMDVLTWQRGNKNYRTMQKAAVIPAINWAQTTVTVDSSGYPALITSQSYEWWNVKHTGAAVVTHSVLAEAARDDPGKGRLQARFTPSGCTTGSTPTDYPAYDSCPAAEPTGSKLPIVPYSVTQPSYCHPFTIEPLNAMTFHQANIWAQPVALAWPPVYCWFLSVRDTGGPYWEEFLQRTMQSPGC